MGSLLVEKRRSLFVFNASVLGRRMDTLRDEKLMVMLQIPSMTTWEFARSWIKLLARNEFVARRVRKGIDRRRGECWSISLGRSTRDRHTSGRHFRTGACLRDAMS